MMFKRLLFPQKVGRDSSIRRDKLFPIAKGNRLLLIGSGGNGQITTLLYSVDSSARLTVVTSHKGTSAFEERLTSTSIWASPYEGDSQDQRDLYVSNFDRAIYVAEKSNELYGKSSPGHVIYVEGFPGSHAQLLDMISRAKDAPICLVVSVNRIGEDRDSSSLVSFFDKVALFGTGSRDLVDIIAARFGSAYAQDLLTFTTGQYRLFSQPRA